MRQHKRLYSLVLSFVASCTPTTQAPVVPDAGSWVPSQNRYASYIEDLTTGLDVRGAPYLTFVVYSDDLVALDASGDLDALSAGLRLVTWPGNESVPHTVSVEPGTASSRFLFVQPVSPLEHRWYAITFERGDLELDYAAESAPSPSTYRFFNGSLPLLRASVAPLSLDAPSEVQVQFGALEPLRMIDSGVSPFDLVDLISDGVSVSCVGSEGDSLESGTLFMICSGVSWGSAVSLNVRPGIESLSGVPLRDPSGRTDARLTWTPSIAEPWAPQELSDEIVAMGAAGEGI